VKDIVENRRRVSFRNKWKTAIIALRENGPSWCGFSLLEIGPGAGRWTVSLLERARTYLGVDISAFCIEQDQWMDGAEIRKLTFGDRICVISKPPADPRRGT
jgi:ubiquinone/menaquinone biosynthesis C-methylase UbiE